jgi:ribonuclease D
VWLIDCTDTAAIRVLREVMTAAPWVVHGGAHDIEILERVLGAVPSRIWDTQIMAGLIDVAFPSSFLRLVETYTNVTLDKGATLTDWKRRPLTTDQIAYAAADVEHLRPLYKRLRTLAEEMGRLDVIGAACDAAQEAAITGPVPHEVWRDLGAAWILDTLSATRLRELCAWREVIAKSDNQPARRIVSDGILLEFARRRPADIPDMVNNRRIPQGLIKKYGNAVLEALEHGERRLAFEPVPLVRRFSEEALLVDWVRTVLAVSGREEGWSVDLLAPKALLWDAILATSPLSDALFGWRSPLIADTVRRALSGQLTVRRTETGWDIR